MSLRLAIAGTLFWALLAVAPQLRAEPQDPDRLRAAMIYNMAKFVRWPPKQRRSELRLCFMQASPVADALQAVSGRPVAGRTLTVTPLAADTSRCSILVYSAEAPAAAGAPVADGTLFANEARSMGSDPSTAGVLTIGTYAGFLDSGGMIQLDVDAKKLVFDVNLGRLRERGLDLSAEVLALARQVVR